MPDFRWKPLPGRFGVSINESSWTNQGYTIANAATSTVYMPMPPGKWSFNKAYVCTQIAEVPASGNCPVTLYKRPAGTTGASDVQLTNALNIDTMALNARVPLTNVAALTDAQRTFTGEYDFDSGALSAGGGGDILVLKFIPSGNVTTQPTNFVVGAELFNLV